MNDLIEIDNNATIKQSNKLIEARYKLSLYEQRMVIAICSQLDENTENFSKVRVRVADIAKFCNFDNRMGYTQVKNTIKKLATRTLEIQHGNDWYITHWLQSAKYISEESVIEYKIDEELKPELLQLKSAYLRTQAAPILTFSRDYSARIYFILKKMLKVKTFDYSLDFFRETLVLGKSYSLFANLKNKVLDPAFKEINEKSDIKVKYRYVKDGRSYSKVHFIVTLKDKAKKIEAQETKLEQEAGQIRLCDEGLSEEAQYAKDRLLARGVNNDVATTLVNHYSAKLIMNNLRYAESQKDTANNLAGLIVSFIKNDTAGKNELEKQEAKKREEARMLEKRQAYDMFNGTKTAEINKAEKDNEQIPLMEEPETTAPLTEIEITMIKEKGEKAGGYILKHLNKLGLTVEDVKEGRYK